MTVRLPEEVLANSGLQKVLAALAPHQALIVGGAVRNALLGEPVDDYDISTELRPQAVAELAQTAGLKVVPTGLDHGTVTVVADGEGFEVTTFRRDVETDGRRAVVEFSDRLDEDAQRRDFTMNALYAQADGTIIDKVGGLADLSERRLRFVGDAATRIAEDYLRILRYFRFHARYGRRGFADADALAACAAGAHGLAQISSERITTELRKLLSARDPLEAVELMQTAGVLAQVLPDADVPRLAAVLEAERHLDIPLDWQLRLAALGGDTQRLRLSKAEARVQDELRLTYPLGEAAYRLGSTRAAQIAALRAADGIEPRADWREQIAGGDGQKLPISAADLSDRLSGPALGKGLKAAEAAWIASDFVMPAPALIDIALLAGES